MSGRAAYSSCLAPAGQQVAPEILAAHSAWVKGSKEIVVLMLMTIEPEIQQNLEPLHAHEMLKELKTLFAQQAEQELLQTTRDFHSCRQEEGQSVSSYVLKMKGYIDNLKRLGHPVTLGLGVSLILIGLRKKYDGFVQNYNMHSMRKTINELHAMLKLHEQTLPKSNAPALNAIRAGKVQKGASYLVTFTDDFSHYGYVYLLKHKHEVFETFKVFQKEVENQLGKTIKSLHFDRGAEYMSQEFLDHLKDHGIIAHRTPPYTPQHNGVSERRNRTLLDMVKKTPYKVWHGKAPKLSYLKVWGCEALVKRDTLTKPDKLEPRSIKCIFIGYPKETMGYYFYYPPENKVLVARNAEFLENILIDQEASGSLEDLEIIQEEDTHPSLDTSLNHEEDDLEIDEPQSDFVPIRRSTRTRHAPDRMCLYIDAEEHDLGDLGEPANYKATLLDPTFKKWLNAMNVEMQSMKDNEVWVLVELPPNGKTIGSKWLYKKKTDMDGNVHIYKARLVVKGYTQTSGIDYEETFSPVANIRAIRILIAIAAYYDDEIWQMDVKTVFLNGYLNEELYMEQHEGFVNPKYPNRVCKLKRSINGLKQASRHWNKRFDDEIKTFGFTQNHDEPCVYIKASGSNITFLILYVDDILIMGNSIPMLQSVKTYLGKCFAMKDLGEATYILEIKIYRDRSKRLIGLCQSSYIEKILKQYCMENSKRGSIHMQEKLKLSKSQGASTPTEMKLMQNVLYASAVGSIMYTVRCTLPDVAFAQNITSRFQHNPELRVSCYTDAGYLTDADDLKSHTGYVFVLNGGAIDWKRAIAIANESRITKSARHFHVKVYYLRENPSWCQLDSKTERKLHVNFGMIRHVDRGKSTLTVAITKVRTVKGKAKAIPFDVIDKALCRSFVLHEVRNIIIGGSIRSSLLLLFMAINNVAFACSNGTCKVSFITHAKIVVRLALALKKSQLKVHYLYCETVLMNRSLVPAKSNSYHQAFKVKSLFGEIDCPKKSQVKLKGSYALSWKPCQRDSLNPPDHRYIADVAASFQRSQIHNIKLSMSNHCLGRFHYNQDYPSREGVDQSRMSRYKTNPSKDRDLDIVGDQKLKTSTLGEIVSLEKSNKNVNGLRILTSYQSMSVWAFQVTADVPEIYMQEFWATAKLHHNSICFKIDTKKSVLDLEAFREMLHISPRIPNQSFAELPSEEEILNFLRFLGHSDSASSTTPPTLTPTTIVESAPRLSATAKGKQPARAITPTEPIDVQRTKAEQLKIALKRSRQETHISQQRGSDTDEGTGKSDEEETREEEDENFDPIPRTHKESEEERNDEEEQESRLSEEARIQEEEDA
nr:hypothetical protein [Tanacetum cinerariifolium]